MFSRSLLCPALLAVIQQEIMNQTHLKHSTLGFAALEKGGVIVPFSFERRAVRAHDVAVRVLYCGICHSDLHAVNSSGSEFPLVPGHEFVGVVTEVGSEDSQFSVGDNVLIGTIVDSCRVCEPCKAEIEIIAPAAINEAFERLEKGDVHYRFVIAQALREVFTTPSKPS